MARRPGASLDRAAVVAAAARLVDARGANEVTLTTLAAHLGIRTSSLYNHIPGQEGLRRELALLGARDLAARMGRAAIGKSGDEALLALAHAYRAFATDHPGLYMLTLRAPAPDDRALAEASEEILAVLRAVLEPYGLRDEVDLLHVIRGWRSLLHGFISLEVEGGFGLPLDLDESFARLLRQFIAGLPRRAAPSPDYGAEYAGAAATT